MQCFSRDLTGAGSTFFMRPVGASPTDTSKSPLGAVTNEKLPKAGEAPGVSERREADGAGMVGSGAPASISTAHPLCALGHAV